MLIADWPITYQFFYEVLFIRDSVPMTQFRMDLSLLYIGHTNPKIRIGGKEMVYLVHYVAKILLMGNQLLLDW
jgi:hypothetical protein